MKNDLTSKQIKELMLEFSPKSDGYVLKLSRVQFEDLVEESTDIDISDNEESNGKRLKSLFKTCTDEQANSLITALRAVWPNMSLNCSRLSLGVALC